jgi:adenylate kinase family enzyme
LYAASGSALGRYIQDHWTLKNLEGIALELAKQEIESHPFRTGFLIDGSPRTLQEAKLVSYFIFYNLILPVGQTL